MEKSKKQKGRSFRKTRKQEGAGGNYSLPSFRPLTVAERQNLFDTLDNDQDKQKLLMDSLSLSNAGLYNFLMPQEPFLHQPKNDSFMIFAT